MKCGEILCFDRRLSLQVVELNDLVGLDQKTHDLLARAQRVVRHKRPLDKK
jgi:hypothetical protein